MSRRVRFNFVESTPEGGVRREEGGVRSFNALKTKSLHDPVSFSFCVLTRRRHVFPRRARAREGAKLKRTHCFRALPRVQLLLTNSYLLLGCDSVSTKLNRTLSRLRAARHGSRPWLHAARPTLEPGPARVPRGRSSRCRASRRAVRLLPHNTRSTRTRSPRDQGFAH